MAALVVSEAAEPGGRNGPGRGGFYNDAISHFGVGPPQVSDRTSPLSPPDLEGPAVSPPGRL